jgi:hypothetical protein
MALSLSRGGAGYSVKHPTPRGAERDAPLKIRNKSLLFFEKACRPDAGGNSLRDRIFLTLPVCGAMPLS